MTVRKIVYVGVEESARPHDVGKVESDRIRMSDGTTIPNTPEAIENYNEGRRAALAAAQAADKRRLALNTGRECPVQFDEYSGHARECKRDCAFFNAAGDACRFSGGDPVETLNEMCPFMKKCVSSCAWYHGGCTLCYLVSKVT